MQRYHSASLYVRYQMVSNAVELCGSVTTMVPVTTAVPAAAGTTEIRVGLMPRLPIPARVQRTCRASSCCQRQMCRCQTMRALC